MLNTIEKIEQIIKDSNNRTPELLYELVFLELCNYKFDFLFTELVIGSKFHRIRVNEKANEPFNKLDDISYPPLEKSIKFNRANRPGQSMFYCSENPSIAEIELLNDFIVDNEIGHSKHCTYSEWKTKSELNLLVLAIADKDKEFCNGLVLREKFNEYLNTKSEEEKKSIIDQYTWSSHFFTKLAKSDKSVYAVTSAIANIVTLRYEFDGFIFPSVQTGTGYNIAFKPYVIDKSQVTPLPNIEMIRWEKTNSKSVNINVNAPDIIYGQINDKQLIWKTPSS